MAETTVAAGQGAVLPAQSSMHHARATHSATLLNNGRVLIAGGMAGNDVFLNSAELFDPATGQFLPTANLSVPRAGHEATLLPDGKVLISGGGGKNTLSSAEIYDPASGTFTPTAGPMAVARTGHSATLLSSGKVLVLGGLAFEGAQRSFTDLAELFDPATGLFLPAGKMTSVRYSHTATRLQNDTVLIVGGASGRVPNQNVLSTAEVYDPVRGGFTATGSMRIVRYKHAASLLGDGRVLVSGGADERDGRGSYFSSEIYDPAPGRATFRPGGDMAAARFKLPAAVAVLPNGRVLVAGGGEQVEIYDPTGDSFKPAQGKLDAARFFSTATLLPSGKVLIAGGYDRNIQSTAASWLYQP